MTRFDVITLFPEIIEAYFNTSIFKRAQKKKLIGVNAWQLRDFAEGKHRKVDDKAFGGGPGMVLKVDSIYRAVQHIKTKSKEKKAKTRIILFSTRGRLFTQKEARRLSKYRQLILVCGRYEGIDERVAERIADEEISIGDFVLSGGEIPAMLVIDAVSRQIPNVIGKRESLEERKGSYPVYTRPEMFRSWNVPGLLLQGNHSKIEEWRRRFSQKNKEKH